MVYNIKTDYLVLLFPVKKFFPGLKFYSGVKIFSLENRGKTIFRNFQLFVRFCNAKTDRYMRGLV